jgi:hypothetical protein
MLEQSKYAAVENTADSALWGRLIICMDRPCIARGFGDGEVGLALMYPASLWSFSSGP